MWALNAKLFLSFHSEQNFGYILQSYSSCRKFVFTDFAIYMQFFKSLQWVFSRGISGQKLLSTLKIT